MATEEKEAMSDEDKRITRERDECAYREGFIRGFFGLPPSLNEEGMNEWQDTDAFLEGIVDGRKGVRTR